VSNSAIFDTYLQNCLLFDAQDNFEIVRGIDHKITKPVIAIPWNFDGVGIFTKAIYLAVQKYGGMGFRFESNSKDIDSAILNKEIAESMAQIDNSSHSEGISIPKQVLYLAEPGSRVAEIRAVAQKALKYADGLILPGGADIQPEFYGRSIEDGTYTDPDYKRSIVEFAALDEAERNGKPTLGICRGSQLINVFFGGTSRQHVDDHRQVFQDLKVNNEAGSMAQWVREILGGEEIRALSMHHQAVEKLGRDMVNVIAYDSVPKLTMHEKAPIIAAQFHPEATELRMEYVAEDRYHNSHYFFTHLIRLAEGRHHQGDLQA
jgi:gamma-glutamyl-gamma-aminobutyrate hydrolase PuuD